MGELLLSGISKRTRLTLLVLAVLFAVPFVVQPVAMRLYMDEMAGRSATTLRLAVSGLESQMRRFEPLPGLISDRIEIRQLAQMPQDPRLRAIANGYLKLVNEQVGSSDIYVMDKSGLTIAASNFDAPVSFVGENFDYRPYFQDAIAGKQGRFFALGTTSDKRGYYFSAPIVDQDAVLGVTVFKVDLDPVESSWRGGEDEIIVHDPEGIIFMTSRADWLYTSLLPLTQDRLARTEASRRYSDRPLRELPTGRSTIDGREVLRVAMPEGRQEYLVESLGMPAAGWTVVVLSNTRTLHAQVWASVAAAALLVAFAALVGAVVMQRRARLAERLELQRSAQEQLERRVEARTADLAEVNRQLEAEVSERRTTEQRLRQTQSDLIQAGKLAALGQMSAALSHEFNQPLAALKAYAQNGVTLIERERAGEAQDNLRRILSLADRMSSISRHLRNFAREPNQPLGPVPVAETVADALEIVTPRLRSAGARIETDLQPDSLVNAGSVRLQQVLVNLLSNAADAIEGSDDRRIGITARRADGKVLVSVRDHGKGVPDAIRERIFDPFYSTKGVGKGLGLGLSISYNIIKDFGGDLSVKNAADGGAVFLITLDDAALAKAAADPVAAE